MAFKPNYRFERAERDRLKKARKDEKLKRQQERASSRDEGGPKAVLESMATGVPLVTTRVGQAADLVVDGESGRILDVDDAEGLADAVAAVADAPERFVAAARATAESCSWDALRPRWSELFLGFVAMGAT